MRVRRGPLTSIGSSHRGRLRVGALLATLALLFAACAGAASPTPPPTAMPTSSSNTQVQTSASPSASPSGIAQAPKLTTMTHVRFAVWGAPTSDMSFIFTAMEKGYFKNENLDVQLVAGQGSADACRHLITGDAQFAWCTGEAVLFAAAQGANIKQIFQIWGNIYGMIYLPNICKCQINSINDLKGLKVGIQDQGSLTRHLLLLALAQAGMSEKDFAQEIAVGYNPAPPMLSGQIDTYMSWPNLSLDLIGTPGFGQMKTWPIANVDYPGDDLVVTQDEYNNNQPLVQAFLRALIMGMRYEFGHEAEVAQFLPKYLPSSNQTPAQLLPQIKNNDLQLQYAGTAENGLGWQDPLVPGKTQDVLVKAGVMPSPVSNVNDLFTNDLVTLYKDYGKN